MQEQQQHFDSLSAVMSAAAYSIDSGAEPRRRLRALLCPGCFLLSLVLSPLLLSVCIPRVSDRKYIHYVDDKAPVYGVVYGVTAPVLIVVLYMAIVGVRSWDPRRYVSINIIIWMLIDAVMSSMTAEHSPWKNWVSTEFSDYALVIQYLAVGGLCGSVTLMYLESITGGVQYMCNAKRYGLINNIVWFFIYIVLFNAIAIFIYVAKVLITDVVWWYDPLEAWFAICHLLAYLVTLLHLLCCVVFSALMPFCGRKRKDPAREMPLFPIAKMWLSVVYGIVPLVMTFPFAMVILMSFCVANFMNLFTSLMDMFSGGGGSTDMDLINLGMQYLGYKDWFMLYLPLVMTLLQLVCFPCFYKPVAIFFTCGRICASKKQKTKSPPPSYPGVEVDKKAI